MRPIGLSFDVEDWFCVHNMKEIFAFKDWMKCELRVYENTKYILKVLQSNNIKATFFVLGWVAERIPELVLDLVSHGHEIASHGYSHTLITDMNKHEFQKDLTKSLSILSNITNKPISGFRAPSFSITEKTMWALKILKGNGIKYDSSIYPIKHPDYGIAGFGPEIQTIDGIIEIPLTTSVLYGLSIPISGGGYFRLYPYWLFKIMMKKKIVTSQAVTYFHPWEFDSEQPRISLPFLKRFRHYVGLKQNRNKFEKFIQDFNFAPLAEIIMDYDSQGTKLIEEARHKQEVFYQH